MSMYNLVSCEKCKLKMPNNPLSVRFGEKVLCSKCEEMTLTEFYMEDANREIEEALKKEAKDIYNRFYMILFDSDSDKSEEINVSTLAKACAYEAINLMEREANKNLVGGEQFNYLREVIKGL